MAALSWGFGNWLRSYKNPSTSAIPPGECKDNVLSSNLAAKTCTLLPASGGISRHRKKCGKGSEINAKRFFARSWVASSLYLFWEYNYHHQ
jgi:hypothetical protein